MVNNFKEDDVVDYSDFNKKPTVTTPLNQEQSPVQKSSAGWYPTRKVVFFSILLVILVLSQLVIFYLFFNSTKPPALPAGYHLVTPQNQPAFIEKNK